MMIAAPLKVVGAILLLPLATLAVSMRADANISDAFDGCQARVLENSLAGDRAKSFTDRCMDSHGICVALIFATNSTRSQYATILAGMSG
jgi:phosphatidylglycerophosphate synthase